MDTKPKLRKEDRVIKKRYSNLTISKKLEIIYAVDIKDKSKTEVAKDFGIPVSTLCTFLKNRENIEKAAAEGKDNRKRLRGAKHNLIEKELILWYRKMRNSNEALSINAIKEKAREIAFHRGIDFKCSNGWLQRFQHRHEIASLCTKTKEPSAESTVADNSYENVKPILDKYALKNIFTCGEIGLLYNLPPDRTEEYRDTSCFEGTKSKERATLLVACNANGTEKLKPLIVAKYEKPPCLEGITHTPLHYKSNKYSWMTSSIFLEWLRDLEKEMAQKNRSILLLMDRSNIHDNESLTLNNIRILFLPTNDLSYTLLPLEQGLFFQLKSLYRKRLVHYYIRKIKKGIPVQDIRKWNILDAMRNMALAWAALDKDLITQAFLKCGFGIANQENIEIKTLTEDFDEWSELQCFMQCPMLFNDFVNVDNSLEITGNFIMEAPVIDFVPDFVDVKGEIEDEDLLMELEAPREVPLPTRTEAYLAISVLDSLSHRRGNAAVLKSMEILREFVYSQYNPHAADLMRKLT